MKNNLYFAETRIRDGFKLVFFAFIFFIVSSKKNYRLISKSLKNFLNVKKVFFHNSARSGLFNILSSLSLPAGSEVIITGFTCSAVAEPVLFNKLKPVYADIDLETFSMTLESVKSQFTSKTKVIIFQHSFGIPGKDFQEIINFSKENNLTLIEDCSLSFGTEYQSRKLGTYGDYSIFSFELSKSITSGWGGLVVANEDKKIKHYEDYYSSNLFYEKNLDTFKKLLQSGLSILFYHKKTNSIGRYLLALFYKTRIFITSETQYHTFNDIPSEYKVIPSPHRWLLLKRQLNEINKILSIQQANNKYFIEVLRNLRVNQEHFSRYGLDTFSPRLPLIVDDKQLFLKLFNDAEFEIGNWFSSNVASQRFDSHVFHYEPNSCLVAEKLTKSIINLPCSSRIGNSERNEIRRILEIYFDKMNNVIS